jgi:uncharacterized protein
MPQANVEIVRNGVEAWMRGDVAAVLAVWDEEIEWIPPPEDPDGAAVVGAAAAGEAMAQWLATWDAYRYELEELIDAGDDVVQAGRQIMAARGAEVSTEVFCVWTIRDSRAVRMRMFYSRDQALKAVGLEG